MFSDENTVIYQYLCLKYEFVMFILQMPALESYVLQVYQLSSKSCSDNFN